MINRVPGYHEAPWGWKVEDVNLRLDQLRAAGVSTRPDQSTAVAPDAALVLAALSIGRASTQMPALHLGLRPHGGHRPEPGSRHPALRPDAQ